VSAPGNQRSVTAAEMTDALVEINDRLARAARAHERMTAGFFCECGNCLAENVPLSLEEHEEIRDREDLIFAPGHDASRPQRLPQRVSSASTQLGSLDFAEWRLLRVQRLVRTARLEPERRCHEEGQEGHVPGAYSPLRSRASVARQRALRRCAATS
jgi:hypothetical protein